MHRSLRVPFLVGLILLMTAVGVTAQVSKEVSPEILLGAWDTTSELPDSRQLASRLYSWGEGYDIPNFAIIIDYNDTKEYIVVDRPGLTNYKVESVKKLPSGYISVMLRYIPEKYSHYPPVEMRVRFIDEKTMYIDTSVSNIFGIVKPILYRISP